MDISVERVREDLNHENNSNNHPKDENDLEIKDLDYETEIARTNLCNYKDTIGYPVSWTYKFTEEEVKTLLECATVGKKVGSARLFADELVEVIDRLKKSWKDGLWFFRFDSHSPKDGDPVFPVMSAKDAINKIVTSKRAWTAMLYGNDLIYFVEYDRNWDTRREFRVFVYHRKVTCISQYYAYDKGMLSGKSNLEAKKVAEIIKGKVDEVLEKVCDKTGTDNLVCDIYVDIDLNPRIIEFNSFGYWLASGSALFHWIRDKKKLYNVDGKIYFRIVK